MSNILKYQNPSSPLLNPHKIIENIPAREWGPRKINEDGIITEGEGTSFLHAPFQYWGNKGLGLQNEKLARDLVSDFTWMMIKNPNYNPILDKNYQSYDDAVNYLNHLEGLKKYLGLPYDTGLLMESKYKPTRLQGTNEKTYKFKSSTVPGYWDDVVEDMVIGEHNKNQYYDQSLNEFTAYRDRDEKGDFVSIYDEWDYNPAVRGGNKELNKVIDSVTGGKPFVIYDRVYLDDYYDIPEEARGNPFITPAVVTAYKKGGRIHIKKKNRGKFTESAKRTGMGVQEFARHVLANKDKYSSTLVKRANFARNAKKFKHENGGILKAQEGTGNLLTPHPLSPVGIALNQAKTMAKMKGEQQHLPSGVKEVVGSDGKKVAMRTEQPLQPLEQSIAEWLPGTGDVAEVGQIADDVKNGNYGTAALATVLTVLPGNAGKLLKTDVGKKISNFLNKDLFNYDELWARIKHPTWKKYYHGSPTEFPIKNANMGRTGADMGLHSSDDYNVAKFFTEGTGPVYTFYAPKPSIEVIDIGRNNHRLFTGEIEWKAGGIHNSSHSNKLFESLLKKYGGDDVIQDVPVDKWDRDNLNYQFPGTGDNLKKYTLKQDVTIPLKDEFGKKLSKDVREKLEEVSKFDEIREIDELGYLDDISYDEYKNQRIAKTLSDGGYKVLKYENVYPNEGVKTSYTILDPSIIHLINPEHQFKMKHALTGVGVGLGIGYGASQLKDE